MLAFLLALLCSALPSYAQNLVASLTGMNGPTFVAIDANRTIGGTTATWLYVSEHGNTNNTGGGHIYRFNLTSGATTPTVVASPGTGDGQFTSPDGILIDAATGDLIIADRALDRVQRITNAGAFVWKFGSSTSGAPDEMHGPCGLATDSSGAIYIAEHGETLSSPPGAGGSYVSKYTISGSGSTATATRVWRIGGIGTGNGQFNNTGPYGVAINGSTLFVTDAYNARVQTFDLSGNYQSQFSIPNTMPLGLYLDSAGALWIAETSNQGSGPIQQVQKYTTAGNYANVTLSGGLMLPFDAVLNGTKAYVADYSNSRVAVFDLSSSGGGGGVPVINSSASASGTVGQSFSYTITASNTPTSFAVDSSTPLPAGLSLNATTGVISGTPTTAGNTTVNVTATNSSGTSAPFALTLMIGAAAPTGPAVTQFAFGSVVTSAFEHIQFTVLVTFSEAVTGVTSNSFTLTTTGISTGTIDSVTAIDASHYQINTTWTGGAPGSLAYAIKTSGSGITGSSDSLPYSGAGITLCVVPISDSHDNTVPTVTSFAPGTSAGNTVNFLLTFSRAIWNVQASNFTVNTTGGATGTIGYAIQPADNTGTVYTIPVTFSGTGTLSLTVSGGTIEDGNGDKYVGPDTSTVFTLPSTGSGGGGGGSASVPVVSNATVTGTVGTPIASVQVQATNSPTSFSASGLSTYGLSISSSGLITGTPTAAANNATVSVTATNSAGTSAPATITLNIAAAMSVPVVSNASVTGTVGTAITPVQVQATNSPTSFSAPGLATYGLVIDSTGWISGTPTTTATNATVNVTATNAAGTSSPATITLNLAAASGGGGGGGGTITTSNGPSIQSFAIDLSTATLTHASFLVTFSEAVTGVDSTDFAVNTQGTATATITGVTAVSTSQYRVDFDYSGNDGSVQMAIKTTGTGITGASGAFMGAGQTASDPVTVNATPPADETAPTVSSFTAGTAASTTVDFTLTFSEPVTGVAASDFLVGTSTGVTATVGTVTGTGATYTVPVTFSGSGSVQLTAIGGATANIRDAATNWFEGGSSAVSAIANVGTSTGGGGGGAVPVVTNASVSGTVGTAITAVQVQATNSPTSFTAPGLATYGLSISASGLITGTPTKTATNATVNVTATNSSGTSTPATITLNIAAASGGGGGGGGSGSVPVVSNASVTGTVGTPIASVQVQATNSPTSFSAPGLANYGLSISSTGAITGTPSTAAANATVSVTATNAAGTSAPATITLNIASSTGSGGGGGSTGAPVVTAPATINGTVGIPLSFSVSATNNPTSYSIVGQPAGVSINASSGFVSGTPSASGNFTATVSATNSAGTGSATVAFSIAASTPPPPPVKKGQTVIFNTPVSAIIIGQPIRLGATSDSGGPITYTIISGNAVMVGDTLTVKGKGPIVIRATQSGDSTWAAASADITLTAQKAAQSISPGQMKHQFKADEKVELNASASSGLPVTYTVVSGPATVDGDTLEFTGAAGTVVVRASQGGDDTFDAADAVTLTFTVDASGEQVFFGKLGSDDLAAAVSADNSKGTLVTRLSSTGEALVVNFTINADGSFSATAKSMLPSSGDDAHAAPMASTTQTRTFTGTLLNGTLSGNVAELGTTFSATVQPPTGPTAAYAGLYTARIPGSASGDAYLVVGSNGQAYALLVTPHSVVSGTGTVSSTGAVSIVTSSGATLTATVNPTSSAVSGEVKDGSSAESFAGISAATVATDRLINVSSRLRVSGSDSTHASIAGFVVTGDTPKQILIRAVGPSLSQFGLKNTLADPALKLFDSKGNPIASNSGWADDAAISAAGDGVGAFKLTAGSHDAALLVTLAPGAYTAQVQSSNNGIVLIEVYDVAANAAVPTKQLINVSTRGYVGTGDDSLIGGFVVNGNQPKRVLVRAVGPGLAQFGVTGTLTDPMLTIYDSKGTVIAKNDNWGTPMPIDASQIAASAADITAAASATGAFPLQAGSADAAIIITLNPGAYTAMVTGANGTTGAALIEVYEIPNP